MLFKRHQSALIFLPSAFRQKGNKFILSENRYGKVGRRWSMIKVFYFLPTQSLTRLLWRSAQANKIKTRRRRI